MERAEERAEEGAGRGGTGRARGAGAVGGRGRARRAKEERARGGERAAGNEPAAGDGVRAPLRGAAQAAREAPSLPRREWAGLECGASCSNPSVHSAASRSERIGADHGFDRNNKLPVSKRYTGRKSERDMPLLRSATQPTAYALTMASLYTRRRA